DATWDLTRACCWRLLPCAITTGMKRARCSRAWPRNFHETRYTGKNSLESNRKLLWRRCPAHPIQQVFCFLSLPPRFAVASNLSVGTQHYSIESVPTPGLRAACAQLHGRKPCTVCREGLPS